VLESCLRSVIEDDPAKILSIDPLNFKQKAFLPFSTSSPGITTSSLSPAFNVERSGSLAFNAPSVRLPKSCEKVSTR
jgi:hypothetical protein